MVNKISSQIQASNSLECVWEPSEKKINTSNLKKFIEFVNQKHSIQLKTFEDLYQWSINEDPANPGVENFWSSFWDFAKIKAEKKGNTIVKNRNHFEKVEWFPEAKLNFAENILRKRSGDTAIVFRGENQEFRSVSG